MDLSRIHHIVLENISEAVYTRDADMNILYMNPAAERLTGWSLKELTGKKCYEVFGAEHPKYKDHCPADEAIAGGTHTFRSQVTLTSRSGAVHEMRASITPAFEAEVMTGAVVVMEDMWRLKEREAASRFWSQNAHDMTWIIDLGMYTKYISPSVEKILGFSPEERINGNALDRLTPESRDLALKTFMKELQRDGDPGVDPDRTVMMEMDYRRKDGTIACLESVFSIIRDEASKPTGVYGLSRDITNRKKAEEDLRRERERLSFVIEGSRLGTWIWNVQTNETVFNATWAALIGYTLNELTPYSYETWARLVHPDDLHMAVDALSRYVEGESPDYECEFRMKHKAGHWVWVLDRGRIMVRDAEGRPLSMFGTHTDITDIKRAQELLMQSERFRAVADLAGGVAHNFNNLLHIVMGNAELALLDMGLGNYSDVERALQNVLASSKFGSETVRRLQSFASIRGQTRGSEQEVFDLSDIVRQSVAMTKTWWKTTADKRGLKISVNVELQDGCLVRAGKNEFFEVVVNLIKNATEALPKGGDLNVQTTLEGDSVVLRVRDTGIGMSEDHLKRLFNPFFTTKAEAGSGLGLASSRKIVEDSGGNILAESALGQGTTFTIRLPLIQHPVKQTAPPAPHVPGAGTTVLVIDDMEGALKFMRSMLTRFGYLVVTASTGLHGLEIFRENPIDVVICDLGMPGMNGWEFGKGVKAICEERGLPKTPFLLLTGWGGQKNEAAHIAESGVDAIIEKPVTIGNLREALRRLTEK